MYALKLITEREGRKVESPLLRRYVPLRVLS